MASTKHFAKRDVALFAATVFTSASLLFQVQPLTGKLILPWFGGGPAVWTTAMLFFQSVLFGGYFYAHVLSSRCAPRSQFRVHTALLGAAAALAVLVVPGAWLKPSGNEDPVVSILFLLAVCVGVPYFCLATTGPLLQHWLAQARPGHSPYRLYALSNAGSFVGLLTFPYVFEPVFELAQLGRIWTAGFWLFALCCVVLVLRVRTLIGRDAGEHGAPTPEQAGPTRRPAIGRYLGWIALPALASLTMIATTDHVSHDIAPEPRVWIATLALYLLTFVVCFDHPRWYRPRWVALACLVSIVLLAGRLEIPGWLGLQADYSVSELRWSHLLVMFLVCFMSHAELYRLRPQDARELTRFYLCVSFGGACGGLFVAVIATRTFADYHEWPLTLVLAIALACRVLVSECVTGRPVPDGPNSRAAPGAAAWAGMGCGLALAALVTYWEVPMHWRHDPGDERVAVRLHQSRNFYGTVTVKEWRYPGKPAEAYRVIYSGQITHGLQFLDPARRRLPLGYYAEGSGVGETFGYAMSRQPSLRVAVVGLGAGTLATFARAADAYDFFEIDPDVVEVAYRWFSNLSDCKAHALRVIVGDARLKMEQLPDDVLYDVIALDAFTGGSLPIHLLTREAFQIYRRHLKPDGFISINITNGYLNLYPVVRRQAEALGIGYRNKYQAPDPATHTRRNQYFVMTDDSAYLKLYPSVNRRHVDQAGQLIRIEDPDLPSVPLWTDHFSSLNAIERRD